MRWSRRSVGVVVSTLVAVGAGCTAGELEPASESPAREKGSHLVRMLAEREAARPRAEPAPPPAPPAFRSPFGHSIAAAPIRHSETSIGGRDLNYWVLGDGSENVLLLGGIHGDERSSADAAYEFLAYMLLHPELLANRRLVIAPEVNPDGIAASTRRNQRDVDLNRNFPASNWRRESGSTHHAPGDYGGSEPETRFVLALLRRFPPTLLVVTHAAAACVNWDGPGEALARTMSRECGLPAKASIGYPTPGSLGSYLGVDRDVPTITFELAEKESAARSREPVRRALLAAIAFAPAGPTLAK